MVPSFCSPQDNLAQPLVGAELLYCHESLIAVELNLYPVPECPTNRPEPTVYIFGMTIVGMGGPAEAVP
jgi:hypothetical protein